MSPSRLDRLRTADGQPADRAGAGATMPFGCTDRWPSGRPFRGASPGCDPGRIDAATRGPWRRPEFYRPRPGTIDRGDTAWRAWIVPTGHWVAEDLAYGSIVWVDRVIIHKAGGRGNYIFPVHKSRLEHRRSDFVRTYLPRVGFSAWYRYDLFQVRHFQALIHKNNYHRICCDRSLNVTLGIFYEKHLSGYLQSR